MSLLDSDGPCYDPDLFASLGDDARKAARENAVTPAYEGEVGQDDGTNDDYFQRPCTCTLACVVARWLTEDYYCREQRSAENDCEGCSHCKYPGIRWPAATNCYDAFPFVERCDYCERFPGDDEAAEVVAAGEGNPIEYAPVPGGMADGYPYVRPRKEG